MASRWTWFGFGIFSPVEGGRGSINGVANGWFA